VEVTEFPTMKHGWVTRGDLKDKNTSQQVQKVLELSLSHFKKYL